MNPRYNNTSPWTAEVSDRAKQYWESGKSASAIGRMLDVSRNAVIGRATRGKWVTPNRHKSHFYGSAPSKPPAPRKPRPPGPSRQIGVDGALAVRVMATRTPPRFPKDRRKPVVAEPTESRNMTLLELGPHDCRYPTSPDDATSHLFCGAPQHDGVYCCHHARICYRETPRMIKNIHGDTVSEHSGAVS